MKTLEMMGKAMSDHSIRFEAVGIYNRSNECVGYDGENFVWYTKKDNSQRDLLSCNRGVMDWEWKEIKEPYTLLEVIRKCHESAHIFTDGETVIESDVHGNVYISREHGFNRTLNEDYDLLLKKNWYEKEELND